MIQDFFYTTAFKKSYESNYNFEIPVDINIDVKSDEKLKFKLINFSMMNSMLNVSSFHKNNKFKITYDTVDYNITIPDGSYTATSLRDKINSIIFPMNLPLSFNYTKETNKYFLVTSVGIIAGRLFFYPLNCKYLFGFTKDQYEIIYDNYYYSENFVNMLPYSKIVLGTNLAFETNIQNNFLKRFNNNIGISNIIAWISRDIPLFSTINYENTSNREIELADKNITSFNFYIMNEYNEYIVDSPECYLHFQLIIYENINWYKRFYKLLDDIYYSLLSLYFKKK
jgi:hypothetical protein